MKLLYTLSFFSAYPVPRALNANNKVDQGNLILKLQRVDRDHLELVFALTILHLESNKNIFVVANNFDIIVKGLY